MVIQIFSHYTFKPNDFFLQFISYFLFILWDMKEKNFADHTAISVSLHKTVYESILLSEDQEGEKQVGVKQNDSI